MLFEYENQQDTHCQGVDDDFAGRNGFEAVQIVGVETVFDFVSTDGFGGLFGRVLD